jgi:hypothetical protein
MTQRPKYAVATPGQVLENQIVSAIPVESDFSWI